MEDFEARATSILEQMANKAVIEMSEVVVDCDTTQAMSPGEDDRTPLSTIDKVQLIAYFINVPDLLLWTFVC